MAFVADASVTLAWVYEDEVTTRTDALAETALQAGFHVPALWPLEVANGLLVSVRRGRVSPEAFDALLTRLFAIGPRIAPPPDFETAASISALARLYNLSAYDAAYLELAKRLAVPLATSDRRLAAASEAEEIAVF
jgi:predicted nucleic acid-binding protein